MKNIIIVGSVNADMVVKFAILPLPRETSLGGTFLMNAGVKVLTRRLLLRDWAVTFGGNIEPWLKSATGRYKIKQYNDGTLVKTTRGSKSQWSQKTPEMNNLDICMYEVIAD
jgi:hypothetical protein